MGILSEVLVHGEITATTLCAKLTCCHAIHQIDTLWVHSMATLCNSCRQVFWCQVLLLSEQYIE